jgi:formylglycine-generating enzyme required for sulfatase activity
MRIAFRRVTTAAAIVLCLAGWAAAEEAGRVLADEWQREFEDLGRQVRALPRPSRKPVPPAAAPQPAEPGLLEEPAVTLGSWYLLGPFDNEGGRGFGQAFPPEKGFDADAVYKGSHGVVGWQNTGWAIQDGHLTKIAGVLRGTTHWFYYGPGLGRGKDLRTTGPWSTIYLHRAIVARHPGRIRASIGATGGMVVWLNGAKVASRAAPSDGKRDAQRLLLDLSAGTNSLLVKICQGEGECKFAFSVEHPPMQASLGLSRETDLRRLAAPYRLEATIWAADRDALDVVLRRAGALLENLRPQLDVAQAAALQARLAELGAAADRTDPASGEARHALYEKVCKLRREIAFRNPLLDFRQILFIKKNPSRGNHFCFQYYGRNAVAGGGLYVLADPFGPAPRLRDVLADAVVANGRLRGCRLQGGCFLSPDLSYDGRTVVFAYTECMGAEWGPESCFHIFRVGADGRGLTQLTDGPWNDFDPCFLPDGRIAFISERRGGFGRCFSPHTPTYTLHAMDAYGSGITALSHHETNEWHPSVTHDGMILYTRWDYVDRETNVAHHPWITSPDGRDARAVHGNFPMPPHGRKARPWIEMDCKPIPGSHRYLATAAPHHGQAFGSLVLITPDVEDDDLASPVRRVTPDVPFPEAEGPEVPWNFATAWPLSEDYYLAVYSPCREVPLGIYLVDAFGNRELLHRDEAINCQSPMPLRGRLAPPVVPSPGTDPRPPPVRGGPGASGEAPAAAGGGPAGGTMACINVYDGMMPWPAGTRIKALRVVEIFPKGTAWADSPRISIGAQCLARGVLGTVPVEPDGSVHFEAPSARPLYFQALDERGLAVQSMRSATYLQPGQRLVCQGCHERRLRAPAAPPQVPLALRRAPSPINPDVAGSYPVLYPRLVQPVLDRTCVPCHRKDPRSPNVSGEVVDDEGRPAPEGWSRSYRALAPLGFWYENYIGRFIDPVHGGSRTTPGQFGARASVLYHMLLAGHHGAALGPEDLHRVALWLDMNTNFYGAYFEADKQARGEAVMPVLDCFRPTPGLAVPTEKPPAAAGPAAAPPETVPLALGGDANLTLARLPPGTFTIGTRHTEPAFRINESPQEERAIEQPFWMAVHEVTQRQYEAVVGRNPSRFKDPARPVENVSWEEAVAFCAKVSERTGRTVRLPTEAEWEYAARAGHASRYCFGDEARDLERYAWFGRPPDGATRPVGERAANDWGLRDMHGNVLEWCADWYVGTHRAIAPDDPRRPPPPTTRVVRGGSWMDLPLDCRAARRRGIAPGYRSCYLGFRVVVETAPASAPVGACSTDRGVSSLPPPP